MGDFDKVCKNCKWAWYCAQYGVINLSGSCENFMLKKRYRRGRARV